jgi:hypothetical protein
MHASSASLSSCFFFAQKSRRPQHNIVVAREWAISLTHITHTQIDLNRSIATPVNGDASSLACEQVVLDADNRPESIHPPDRPGQRERGRTDHRQQFFTMIQQQHDA